MATSETNDERCGPNAQHHEREVHGSTSNRRAPSPGDAWQPPDRLSRLAERTASAERDTGTRISLWYARTERDDGAVTA